MIGIILLGQSNSGKSTLGMEVANRLGIRYISSGDIARSMKDEQVQEELVKGEMAPEDEMRSMVLHEINSSDVPYILDGFPRFYDQYIWMNNNINYDLIYVYIDVPHKDILARAMTRNRDDDGYISKKIQFFEENTEPMIRKILDNDEHIYIIDNSNNRSIKDNIGVLTKIVEEYLC